MGVRYVIGLNVSKDCLDRLNVEAVNAAVRSALQSLGMSIEGPNTTKSLIDSFVRPRGNVVVGFNVTSLNAINEQQTRSIDAAVVSAINNVGGFRWGIQAIVSGLSSQGASSYRPSWFGDVTDVVRDVVPGTGVPGTTTTHPTSQTVVQATTDSNIAVGQTSQSSIREAAGDAAKTIADNKGLLYGGLVVAGVVAIAMIVVKVKD
jgi:hypothetical protein